ncbi:MAG: hypothetical protein ISR65_17020 [Bacteriovoracaceae bacterium]|nr:hypothetical protein [Bacteriovoracaceae bacterium]
MNGKICLAVLCLMTLSLSLNAKVVQLNFCKNQTQSITLGRGVLKVAFENGSPQNLTKKIKRDGTTGETYKNEITLKMGAKASKLKLVVHVFKKINGKITRERVVVKVNVLNNCNSDLGINVTDTRLLKVKNELAMSVLKHHFKDKKRSFEKALQELFESKESAQIRGLGRGYQNREKELARLIEKLKILKKANMDLLDEQRQQMIKEIMKQIDDLKKGLDTDRCLSNRCSNPRSSNPRSRNPRSR